MKRIVYFDSGTTNSRAYLVVDGKPTVNLKHKIGTVDNVLSGNKETLLKGLKVLYDELLEQCDLKDSEIDGVYMSGMATSKNGVLEVPYLETPVTVKTYAADITYWDAPIFNRKIGFLTGLVSKPGAPTMENIEHVSNVRGEEIEIFGIMSKYPELFVNKNTALIMPGSHNHLLYTKNCAITGISSCFGGEAYAAFANHTMLNASVDPAPDKILPEMVKKGYDMVMKYGVNRALYITRAMYLFDVSDQVQRNSYLEGVINAGIITALRSYEDADKLDYVCCAGSEVYFEIFQPIIGYAELKAPFVKIEQDPAQSFALTGFLEIMK